MKKFLLAVILISSCLFGMENDPDIIDLSNKLSQCPAAYKKAEDFIKKIESNTEALKITKQANTQKEIEFWKSIDEYKYAFSLSSLSNSTKNAEKISKEDEELLLISLDILHNTVDSIINRGFDSNDAKRLMQL